MLARALQLLGVAGALRKRRQEVWDMFKLMVKMIRFRMGQKVAKKTAKKIGLKPAWLMGMIGGFKAL